MNNKKLFYRYRALNAFTLKELLYGELFLSSLDELNDPYDTNLNFIFPNEKELYSRLLNHYFTDSYIKTKILNKNTKSNLTKAINFLSKSTNTYNELIELIDSDEFTGVLFSCFYYISEIPSYSLAEDFKNILKYNIHKALGKHTYICSFSKTYNEPIVWSHYADQHKGFCIIFKPIKNRLITSPENPYPFGTNASHFKFQKINYTNTIKPINAFYNFNTYINGEKANEFNHRSYWQDYNKATLTKSRKWNYEQEYRISISHLRPQNISKDGASKIPSAFRIFRYDQSQIDGIIIGSRVSQHLKEELIATIHKMKELEKLKSNNLGIYQAIINTRKFELDIKEIKRI